MDNKKPVDVFLVENPDVLGTHGERAARLAWAAAEKAKNDRIKEALHYFNAGDFEMAKFILEGAAK